MASFSEPPDHNMPSDTSASFVEGARDRPAEFRRRLGNLVRKSARNEQFGMVRE
jgi:hypothetical protein